MSYVVSAKPLTDKSRLQDEWLDLQSRSSHSFFISWAWIGVWIDSFETGCDVFRVYYQDQLVALAIIARSTSKHLKVLSAISLHLNEVGDPRYDQIWTEYNEILAADQHREGATLALMTELVEHYPDWDELVIGAVTKDVAERMTALSGLDRIDLWHSPFYGVDLKSLRDTKQDYLSSLSSNTRYQIRRSIKLYAQQGSLEIVRATSPQQALEFFNMAGPLHQQKWGRAPGQSGFANPIFVDFHTKLIEANWSAENIDVLKVMCGEKVLAYVYNFIYAGTVLFYLGAVIDEQDAKLKPGLVAHALCIEQYMNRGFDYYDFMGGDNRYKSSMGQVAGTLYRIALQKKRVLFAVEKKLRSIKSNMDFRV